MATAADIIKMFKVHGTGANLSQRKRKIDPRFNRSIVGMVGEEMQAKVQCQGKSMSDHTTGPYGGLHC